MLVLKKKTEDFCITYEQDDVNIKFWVVPLTEGKIRRISQRSWEFKGEDSASPNIGKFTDDKLDALINKWEGIVDENGKSVPCTKANKIKFYENYPDIIDDFLLPEVDKLMEKNKEKKGNSEKN